MEFSWGTLEKRQQELISLLLAPNLSAQQRSSMQKELLRLDRVLQKRDEIEQMKQEVANLQKERSSTVDGEMLIFLDDEIRSLEQKKIKAETDLEDLMVPPDEHDERSVFLEIRAGTGGQEAALFAADLVRMYTGYALKRHWRVAVVDQSFTPLGGLRDITLHIQGDGAYGDLKREVGVHRVQRVPKTESSGRIHTSTATVAVLPEADEVEVNVNPADLRIDTYRASGAGGQHVNTTDSAIRITHIPSGLVVTCQDERSQHKNKAKALKMLQSRLLAHEIEKRDAEVDLQRKEMIGRGMRSEKVRTYNYPQNRITDHQINLTLTKLDIVMEGALDEIIDALREQERQERRMLFFEKMK